MLLLAQTKAPGTLVDPVSRITLNENFGSFSRIRSAERYPQTHLAQQKSARQPSFSV